MIVLFRVRSLELNESALNMPYKTVMHLKQRCKGHKKYSWHCLNINVSFNDCEWLSKTLPLMVEDIRNSNGGTAWPESSAEHFQFDIEFMNEEYSGRVNDIIKFTRYFPAIKEKS